MRLTVFLGPPGSGKGTQAKRLAEEGAFLHLSTGDILRDAIQKGTELGKSARTFMDKGELVPDSVMIGLIENRLRTSDPGVHILLDGFPRTIAQAEALEHGKNTRVGSVVYFDIGENKLITRLTGRRTCKKCGESYHVQFLPPQQKDVCDKCGGELLQRADDQENVVRKRLDVYKAQTASLLDFYNSQNKLHRLAADQPIDLVQKELGQILH